jgi:hypothetical protein
MKKMTLITLLAVLAVLLTTVGSVLAKDTDQEIKDLRQRLQKLELKANKSKILWSGDLRIEAHSLAGETAPSLDGMDLQRLTVNSLFAVGAGGVSMPASPAAAATFVDDVNAFIMANPAEYDQFLNGLTFDQLGQMMAGFTPQQQAGLMALLMPNVALDPAQKTDNDLLYTTRLRLDMDADVAANVTFSGRMSMYKPWGASTQIGMFNGQANTLAMDANEPGVPGSSTLKVERAYFNWNNLLDQPMYLSLGRRPSTDGPPLHYRHDEARGGTPMGTIIDFQFDGATFGYHVGDHTALRACYGLGYESQYGNGTLGNAQEKILKDASFFGFNIDAWNAEDMQIQTTVARAFNITDGFNGYVIMPANPVTGQAMPGPIVTRFSPSVNLGDFDLASLLLARRDGPVDWFLTGSWSKSKPVDGVTTPFGGMFADPFAPVEQHTGSMYYLGARYNFNEDKTKVGLEWNRGSQYWFNFAPSQDDLIAPKTSTRGTVWEGYVTHRVNRKFVAKLAYINYDYDYSGSGWHLGAPKDLDTTPILGFPTYKKASKVSLAFSARF